MNENHLFNTSRRIFLQQAGAGFGGVALSAMRADNARAEAKPQLPQIEPGSPLSVRTPPLKVRAKNVVFLFMYGGPSHVDLFDYKPLLKHLDGQQIPASLLDEKHVSGVFSRNDKLMAGPWEWQQHGEGGLWISDLMPGIAQHADKLCMIHSMQSDSSNHAPSMFQMNTGATIAGKPSLGSWITYGLGSENQDLPGFVLLFKVAGLGGSVNWSNSFLPAAFQGTPFRYEGPPVLDLAPPADSALMQRSTIDFIQALNRSHRSERPAGPLDLDGRIASYELAYRMQSEALDLGDLSQESAETLELYGLNDGKKANSHFARMCLLSRRMVEKGVRFVQLYSSADKMGWDGHDNNAELHRQCSQQTDQPIAGLLTDLERRGLLDETLVVWAGEFGRTPTQQGNHGRNHNPYGFTIWMAGGGVKGGQSIGGTDEIGLRATEQPFAFKDLHATILTALGLNPDDLSFEHNGRQERLTGVARSWKTIPGIFG